MYKWHQAKLQMRRHNAKRCLRHSLVLHPRILQWFGLNAMLCIVVALSIGHKLSQSSSFRCIWSENKATFWAFSLCSGYFQVTASGPKSSLTQALLFLLVNTLRIRDGEQLFQGISTKNMHKETFPYPVFKFLHGNGSSHSGSGKERPALELFDMLVSF